MYMYPPSTAAASFAPLEDEAMVFHAAMPESVCSVHVISERAGETPARLRQNCRHSDYEWRLHLHSDVQPDVQMEVPRKA